MFNATRLSACASDDKDTLKRRGKALLAMGEIYTKVGKAAMKELVKQGKHNHAEQVRRILMHDSFRCAIAVLISDSRFVP